MILRFTLLFFLIAVFSCKSPQKHFEKGNFEKAFQGALKDLEKSSSDRKKKNILNKSFEQIVLQHQTDWELAQHSNHIEDLEDVYDDRSQLVDNYLKAKRWLNVSFSSTLETIETEQENLRIELAANFWQLGEEAMIAFDQGGDKLIAQEAHQFYKSSGKYDPQNPDLQMKLDEAYKAGSIIVLFEADAWDISDEWIIDRRFQQLRRNSRNFYQVFYEEPVENVDCFVEIDFSRLDYREERRTENREYEKEIQDGYETVIDSSGNSTQKAIYTTVRGTVELDIIQRNYNWEARARVDLIDNYCNYRTQDFDINRNYTIENYRVRGDRRAVPEQYKNDNDRNRFDDDDILEELVDDIYREIERYFF